LNRKLEGPRASLDGFEKRKYSSSPGFELNPQSLYDDHHPVSTGRWEDNIKIGIQETGWAVWTGSIWLRIGARGGLL
jgi:hypothetical protein